MVRGAEKIDEFLETGKNEVGLDGLPLVTDSDDAFVRKTMDLLDSHGFTRENQSVLYLTDDYAWSMCSGLSIGVDVVRLNGKYERQYMETVYGSLSIDRDETREEKRARAAEMKTQKMLGLDCDEWVGLQMERELAAARYVSPATIEKAAEDSDDKLLAVKMVPRKHRAVAVCWAKSDTPDSVTLDVKDGKYYEHDVDLDYAPVHWTDSSHWLQMLEAYVDAKARGIDVSWEDEASLRKYAEASASIVSDRDSWFKYIDGVLAEASPSISRTGAWSAVRPVSA